MELNCCADAAALLQVIWPLRHLIRHDFTNKGWHWPALRNAMFHKIWISQKRWILQNLGSHQKTLKLTKEFVFLSDAAPTHPLHCCTLAIRNTINDSLTFNIAFLLHICASHPHQLKRLQLLLHQKELLLRPQLLMLQTYTRNTYAYWTPFS